MNEAIAIGSFVVLVLLVMAAARLGKTYLFILSTAFILVSNITVQIPVNVFGATISWAVIVYSMIYLITDILSECYKRATAYKLAACNLAVQVLLWSYVWSSLQVEPTAGGDRSFATMRDLFSTTARITFAAIIASAGAFLDIWVYEWLMKRKQTGFISRLWVRNNLSTWLGQSLNTVIFFVLALYGEVETRTLVSIILTAVLVKIVIAACDTPFLYLARKFEPSEDV